MNMKQAVQEYNQACRTLQIIYDSKCDNITQKEIEWLEEAIRQQAANIEWSIGWYRIDTDDYLMLREALIDGASRSSLAQKYGRSPHYIYDRISKVYQMPFRNQADDLKSVQGGI